MEEQIQNPTDQQIPSQPVSITSVGSESTKSKLTILLIVIILMVLIGLGGVAMGKYLNFSQTTLPQPTIVPRPTLIPSATTNSDVTTNWKTYTNQEYAFLFEYPQQMIIEEEKAKDPYYDLIAKFSTINYGISVRAIRDIDIYNKVPVENVAKREIMDSGFEYDIINSQINGLSVAKTLVNDPAKRVIATIANPDKNLFIEISMTGTAHQLDEQILSTFKFLSQLQKDKGSDLKTVTFQVNKETAVSGKETINVGMQIPSDWTLQTNNKATTSTDLIKNCADYIVSSSDSKTKITISPICSGWSAIYSKRPLDAINVADGIVRYFDNQKDQYKYVGEDKSSNQIEDAVLIKYNPVTGNFLPTNISFTTTDKSIQSVLVVVDKIVSSVKAQ